MSSHVTSTWRLRPHFPRLLHSCPIPATIESSMVSAEGLLACIPIESGALIYVYFHSFPCWNQPYLLSPPHTPSPSLGATPEVIVVTSQHCRIHLGLGANRRMPTYMKETHLQRLVDFISLSEKRSEITSPFCNNNRSFTFICTFFFFFTLQPTLLKVKSQHFLNYPKTWKLLLLSAFHHPSPHLGSPHYTFTNSFPIHYLSQPSN